jgi:hypothetical protein
MGVSRIKNSVDENLNDKRDTFVSKEVLRTIMFVFMCSPLLWLSVSTVFEKMCRRTPFFTVEKHDSFCFAGFSYSKIKSASFH